MTRAGRAIVWVGALAAAAAGVGAASAALLSIPEPPKQGGRTLFECLWARHSTRQFAPDPLPDGALGRILWAAGGLNRADGKRRTAPSAFECYPVSIHVVEKDRAARYDPSARSLVPVKEAAPGEQAADFRVQVTGASAFAIAPVILVFSIDLARFPERAVPEMRLPWAHAECGAIGQNVSLACAELDLGTVFSSLGRVGEVRAFLGLKETEHPCYMMPIGKPK